LRKPLGKAWIKKGAAVLVGIPCIYDAVPYKILELFYAVAGIQSYNEVCDGKIWSSEPKSPEGVAVRMWQETRGSQRPMPDCGPEPSDRHGADEAKAEQQEQGQGEDDAEHVVRRVPENGEDE
jgi:hypothetical protein